MQRWFRDVQRCWHTLATAPCSAKDSNKQPGLGFNEFPPCVQGPLTLPSPYMGGLVYQSKLIQPNPALIGLEEQDSVFQWVFIPGWQPHADPHRSWRVSNTADDSLGPSATQWSLYYSSPPRCTGFASPAAKHTQFCTYSSSSSSSNGSNTSYQTCCHSTGDYKAPYQLPN